MISALSQRAPYLKMSLIRAIWLPFSGRATPMASAAIYHHTACVARVVVECHAQVAVRLHFAGAHRARIKRTRSQSEPNAECELWCINELPMG